MIEQLIGAKPPTVQANFYRTVRDAEVDLVLHSSRVRVAIKCKFSSTPKPARGFHEAMVDLEADEGFVIAPVCEAFDRAGVVDQWFVGCLEGFGVERADVNTIGI